MKTETNSKADPRITTTPTMRTILVAALGNPDLRVTVQESRLVGGLSYAGMGSAMKGLKERGYVADAPDAKGNVYRTLTPAGREKALAIRAAESAK